jgi:hypothetical protein
MQINGTLLCEFWATQWAPRASCLRRVKQLHPLSLAESEKPTVQEHGLRADFEEKILCSTFDFMSV